MWLFRCSTFLIRTEHLLVSKEQVSYISETVGTCVCCPLTAISTRKEARQRNHPSLKLARLYIVVHVKTFNRGCVMDIYTAVENLGHPGSHPTEEASYRFLCCLYSQSISFMFFLILLHDITFLWCHWWSQSGSSGGSSHTQHWWTETKCEEQTRTPSRDTRSSHYDMMHIYSRHTHTQIKIYHSIRSCVISPEGARKATWPARCCFVRLCELTSFL